MMKRSVCNLIRESQRPHPRESAFRDLNWIFKPGRNEDGEEKTEEIDSEPFFALFVSSWFAPNLAVLIEVEFAVFQR
jgi:hypothetical protein